MALSNILKEPRREITEILIGVSLFGVYLVGDYYFAQWFYETTNKSGRGCPWPIGMVFGLIATVVIIMFIVMAHGIGEMICDNLERRNIHLRPRRR